MRITLTLDEFTTIAEIVRLPLPAGVDTINYKVNSNLVVERNNAGVTIMRGAPRKVEDGIYVPGTK